MPLPQALGAAHLAVDLGTSCTRMRGPKGASFEGASMLAVDIQAGKIVAVGDPAKAMAGRTPPAIETVAPIRRGVITDFDAATRLLWHAIGRQRRGRLRSWLPPRVVAGVPAQATEVQQRAVEEAFEFAGARSVHLLPKVTLAAIGAGVPVWDATGTMIVDIGAGTTEVAAFAFGNMVAAVSSTTAGDTFGEALRVHLQGEYNLALSAEAAEEVKISLSRAAASGRNTRVEVRGRDRISDLPKSVTMSAGELMQVVAPEARRIAASVAAVVGKCPPSVADDIVGRGLVLTGGGALLGGLAEHLGRAVGMAVHLVDSPQTSVVDGAVRWLADAGTPSGRQPLLAPI
ncbi:rod shape-determining protein [Streptomyces pathocidini]|uniref:Cell shape-determining protein MreB n=1 Tax=Streptomyces pathocidini TaxID=1650571 RepID=A0ABW7UQX9_9ACTN|nr:rod shape-determining protein [Streptomyces pathocidini]